MNKLKIIFTEHAREQLRERKISQELVEEVLKDPEQVVQDAEGNPIAQSRYFDKEEGKEMLLRVFYREEQGTRRVITVYKTSRIRKYWKQEEGDPL